MNPSLGLKDISGAESPSLLPTSFLHIIQQCFDHSYIGSRECWCVGHQPAKYRLALCLYPVLIFERRSIYEAPRQLHQTNRYLSLQGSQKGPGLLLPRTRSNYSLLYHCFMPRPNPSPKLWYCSRSTCRPDSLNGARSFIVHACNVYVRPTK